jgi:hypothetical protein
MPIKSMESPASDAAQVDAVEADHVPMVVTAETVLPDMPVNRGGGGNSACGGSTTQ